MSRGMYHTFILSGRLLEYFNLKETIRNIFIIIYFITILLKL